MIKKKHKKGTLLKVKLGNGNKPKKPKEKTMKNMPVDNFDDADDSGGDFGSDDAEIDFEATYKKENTKTGKPKKSWSPEEMAYVLRGCTKTHQATGPIPLHVLDYVAEKANANYHNGEILRTGEAIWWLINRKQKSGDPRFSVVTITGGSPKRTSGTTNYRKNQTAAAKPVVKGQIHGAMKEPVLPKPPVIQKTKSSPGKKGNPLQVMVKDSTGNIQKVTINSFSSIEDFLFAIA